MRPAVLFLLAVLVAVVPTVAQVDRTSTPMSPIHDSFSRPEDVEVRHLDMDLKVDFENKVISGKVTLFIKNRRNADKLYLDTRGLVIKNVTLGSKNQKTTFTLGEPVAHIGQPLIIDISQDTKTVNVTYETSPASDALQWLSPEQTFGKKRPFLYTQSQPILARTWVPCQDIPAVRFTYRAKVRVPAEMLALMSAQNPVQKSARGTYEFFMSQPIPSYLLALAVGDIQYKNISSRCGVYAEPSIVESAAWEFADVDSMLKAGERFCGAYRWQRYDVLVLPQSFPLGGMENPRLTFVTPTLLAGDRSLVSVIAHEIAHSWSGNLVTNATWTDLWLNEGMTTYIGRRIIETLYGRDQSEMEALLGLQDLKSNIAKLGQTNVDTRLRTDTSSWTLDGSRGNIPYEKGYLFLRTLEETAGRDNWDAFLCKYFDTFAFKTISTDQFLAFLHEQIKDDLARSVDLERWVNQPGLPDSLPAISSHAFQQAEFVAKSFLHSGLPVNFSVTGWSAQKTRQFLRSLPKPLTTQQMDEIDRHFNFTTTGNSEILHEWLLHVIASSYQPAFPALQHFLQTVGRLKYLKPLYAALVQTSQGREFAHRVYAQSRPSYHPIARRVLESIVP